MKKMQDFVKFIFSLLLVFGFLLESHAEGKKPNIVVILTDDQGWGDLSLNGNSNLKTPNIDQLARDGASFDRFFVCPVCSPTRAEFLTGRYHARSGIYSTSAGGERLNLDEKTIADSFKAAGYATGAFGKWHNGMQYPYHPNGRGFDEYYGFCSGHWGNYFDPMLERNGQLVRGKGFIIDDLTNQAMDFIEKNKDRPFFAYIPYNTPHSPMQVPDEFWDKHKDQDLTMRHRDPEKEEDVHTRAALAMCENIDWNVQRVLKKLDELDLAEDTIVVYFCDNGPNGWRWNGGMKGRKGSTDEGGVRSPLLIRWPGKIAKGKKVEPIASVIDLLPTLTDLAGIKVVSEKALDGISLKSLILGNPKNWKERTLINQWGGKNGERVSLRTQRFRLDTRGALFDMENDPGQENGVAKKFPEVAAKLRAQQQAWRDLTTPTYKKDGRPFIIGHPDFRYTQIPARDGIAHGGIERSSRHPNCTYFYHWTKLADKITWDVEVPAAGDFEVEILYTCPAADVGSVFELVFNQNKLVGRITEAYDPPLLAGKANRAAGTEGDVKYFKTLKLGTMHLDKGKGELILRATEIPGKQVMDFRLIMLKRKD
ncbi:MAG: arylsulfatase [Verrucomicrobiales bacterium]|nr:arylsulfatase [Verrucomicrobiales bacterium]